MNILNLTGTKFAWKRDLASLPGCYEVFH